LRDGGKRVTDRSYSLDPARGNDMCTASLPVLR
jgi:hypothetical protein